MNNQEILKNGPKGWTHVEIYTDIIQKPNYYRRDKKAWLSGKYIYDWWDGNNEQWLNSSSISGDFHSRSDIERIVELEKERDSIQESYNAAIETCKDLHFQIEKYEHSMVASNLNNIKADAIEEALHSLDANSSLISPRTGRQYLQHYADKLRKGDV